MTLAAGAMTAAPTARSAMCPGGTVLDPITGVCWSQNNPSNSWGGSGNIPCLPGRLGLCLGALQNTPLREHGYDRCRPPASRRALGATRHLAPNRDVSGMTLLSLRQRADLDRGSGQPWAQAVVVRGTDLAYVGTRYGAERFR